MQMVVTTCKWMSLCGKEVTTCKWMSRGKDTGRDHMQRDVTLDKEGDMVVTTCKGISLCGRDHRHAKGCHFVVRRDTWS